MGLTVLGNTIVDFDDVYYSEDLNTLLEYCKDLVETSEPKDGLIYAPWDSGKDIVDCVIDYDFCPAREEQEYESESGLEKNEALRAELINSLDIWLEQKKEEEAAEKL